MIVGVTPRAAFMPTCVICVVPVPPSDGDEVDARDSAGGRRGRREYSDRSGNRRIPDELSAG